MMGLRLPATLSLVAGLALIAGCAAPSPVTNAGEYAMSLKTTSKAVSTSATKTTATQTAKSVVGAAQSGSIQVTINGNFNGPAKQRRVLYIAGDLTELRIRFTNQATNAVTNGTTFVPPFIQNTNTMTQGGLPVGTYTIDVECRIADGSVVGSATVPNVAVTAGNITTAPAANITLTSTPAAFGTIATPVNITDTP